ncbi:MAG: GNAT family N-acetyltransferase [Gammaproteobacteria bacterium]|nr:GNAT family N-acetyltransferase [Gammaproteobacteria bacterium]
MSQYTIEPAREEDISKLASIERAAAALFPDDVISPEARASVVPLELLIEARLQGCLWVALTPQQEPVGFIMAALEDGVGFIVEVDVLPHYQGRGLGRALIQRVGKWAHTEGLSRVTLTTFSKVRWNAPFYQRLGFKKIATDELTPEFASKLANEGRRGLKERVAMELLLASDHKR